MNLRYKNFALSIQLGAAVFLVIIFWLGWSLIHSTFLTELTEVEAGLIDLIINQRGGYWNNFWIAVTFFGQEFALITALGLWLYLFYYNRKLAYLAGLNGLVGVGLVFSLKGLTDRSRPEVFNLLSETTASFPSGHSFNAGLLFGWLSVLIWQSSLPKSLKTIYCLGLVVIIVLVGFSRIYLGVHYPSDVIAGFLLAGLWLGLGVWLAKRSSCLWF